MNWSSASENVLTGIDIHCISAIPIQNSIIVNMLVVKLCLYFFRLSNLNKISLIKRIFIYVFLASLNYLKHS